jgi:hypothetical protein
MQHMGAAGRLGAQAGKIEGHVSGSLVV